MTCTKNITLRAGRALAADDRTFAADDITGYGFVLDDDISFDGDQLDREERAALRRVAGPLHRARGRHRGRVPPAAPGAGRARRRLDRGHRRRRRELAARARRARRDRRRRRCSTASSSAGRKPDAGDLPRLAARPQELRDIVIAEGADTVVCDGELSPGQRRALEDVVKVKVIDRTALILDIFAQHAKCREGKAQVELAQLQYLLPRLRGWGESMSRQAGGQAAGGQGMGSRGPGETKIELDRRRIRTQMAKLRREIKEMKTGRDTKRQERKAQRRAERRHRRLHQRRQVLAAQPPHRRRRARRERAVRHPRPDRAPGRDARRAGLHAGRHRRLRARTCRTSSSRRSAPRWRRSATPTCSCTSSTARTPTPRGRSPRCARSSPTSAPTDVTEIIVINKADAADPRGARPAARATRSTAIVVSARTGAGHRRAARPHRRRAAAARHRVEVLVPYDRGDLVSRLHEEARCSPASTPRTAPGSRPRSTGTWSATSRPSPSETRHRKGHRRTAVPLSRAAGCPSRAAALATPVVPAAPVVARGLNLGPMAPDLDALLHAAVEGVGGTERPGPGRDGARRSRTPSTATSTCSCRRAPAPASRWPTSCPRCRTPWTPASRPSSPPPRSRCRPRSSTATCPGWPRRSRRCSAAARPTRWSRAGATTCAPHKLEGGFPDDEDTLMSVGAGRPAGGRGWAPRWSGCASGPRRPSPVTATSSCPGCQRAGLAPGVGRRPHECLGGQAARWSSECFVERSREAAKRRRRHRHQPLVHGDRRLRGPPDAARARRARRRRGPRAGRPGHLDDHRRGHARHDPRRGQAGRAAGRVRADHRRGRRPARVVLEPAPRGG